MPIDDKGWVSYESPAADMLTEPLQRMSNTEFEAFLRAIGAKIENVQSCTKAHVLDKCVNN